MSYVLRRDRLFYAKQVGQVRYEFLVRGPHGIWVERANRVDQIPGLVVVKNKADAIATVDDWLELEKQGWELYQYRSRATPGLKAVSQHYLRNVRSICGSSSMMDSHLRQMGYVKEADAIKDMITSVRKDMQRRYKIAKKEVEDRHAKSGQ